MASAEEAVKVDQHEKDSVVAPKANESVSEEDILAGDVIPQVDGTADANANFKIEMKAHHECSEEDIVEAL